MNATSLFVELLVVGIGTAIWLALFLAAILKYRFNSDVLQPNTMLIGALTALVYVLGIAMDRLVRGVFISTVEKKARQRVFTHDKLKHIGETAPEINSRNLPMELEKFIRAHSEFLAAKIDYNRSRLRICRAWVIHFALIGLGFLCWNARVDAVPWMSATLLTGVDGLLLALCLRATSLLAQDHHRDLIESFDILMLTQKKEMKRAARIE